MGSGKGGKRDGAGRPPGRLNNATITKEQAREAMASVIRDRAAAMVEAQVAHALGLKYLVARDKVGKFKRLSQEEADALLAGENPEFAVIEVWDKDPSVQAFTDLMNRAFDKPAEQVQQIAHSGGIEISWLSSKP